MVSVCIATWFGWSDFAHYILCENCHTFHTHSTCGGPCSVYRVLPLFRRGKGSTCGAL